MTIFEIAEKLPNGFHDAELQSIRVDYRERSLELDLDVWIGSLDDPPSTETYRQGKLWIKPFRYCAIELPDESYPYATSVPPTIDLVEPTAFVPEASFGCRLWVNEWNTFVHIAGDTAEFEWTGEPVNRGAS